MRFEQYLTEKYAIEVAVRDARKAIALLKDEKIKHKSDGSNYYTFKSEDDLYAAEDAFKRAKIEILELKEAVEVAYTDLRKNKRMRKKFKDQKALEKWLDKMEGDIKVDAYLNEAKKIKSRNTIWGFYNEVANRLGDKMAPEAFSKAANAIMIRFKVDAGTARDYLDSRSGRHLADSLSDAQLGSPNAVNMMKHPWIKKDFTSFIKGYDPKEFARSVR
jgi:hypothetical protein